MKFIKSTRIKFSELYQDSLNFIRGNYENLGKEFTMASPMGQLLQIVLHTGRMILYYIEDSITELNIRKASRPENIRGIATITGHNPSRAMAARGSLRLIYNGEDVDMYGNTIIIPNYTELISSRNGLTYTMILSSEEVRINLDSPRNYIDVNVMQGKLEYQQATGTGDPLQSFNFQAKKGASIDNFFVNVYVNGKKWPTKESILDMTFEEEVCLVKSGATGGIDIFFGNTYNGAVPPLNATILVEYLITDGQPGNLDLSTDEIEDNWDFKNSGYSINAEEIEINKFLNVSMNNEITFGTLDEPLYLTRLLAPNTSRSYSLINTTSYIYFLKKLNMFSVVDAIPGFATFEDRYVIDKYNKSQTEYEQLNNEYRSLIARVGSESESAIEKKKELTKVRNDVYHWQNMLQEQKKDDNTVYLFLIPDVNKRIRASQNYFTANINKFKLTEREKVEILNHIEESGRRCITVENQILDINYPRFTLNLSLILYTGYEYSNIREEIIEKSSEYFLNMTRRDRIPCSDIVRIIEQIEGVDSVYAWFDADMNNINIYNEEHYGLDNYNDILLYRNVKDAFGNKVPMRDIYPLIRGGFESIRNIEYEDTIEKGTLGSLNIQVRGYSEEDYGNRNANNIINR